jgi:hypothetical protein
MVEIPPPAREEGFLSLLIMSSVFVKKSFLSLIYNRYKP